MKFWKKEFVGRGDDKRLGAKKSEGSGSTVDCVLGKRNGKVGSFFECRGSIVGGGSGSSFGESGGEGEGEGEGLFVFGGL